MAKISKVSLEFNPKSIGLGIVLGLTLTAVIVAAQAFLGFDEFNKNLRFTFDRIRSVTADVSQGGTKTPDYTYPPIDSVMSAYTDNWNRYTSEELGISFLYPDSYVIESNGTKDCMLAGSGDDCFRITMAAKIHSFDAVPSVITFSTSNDQLQLSNMSNFPTVMLLGGKQQIFQQFRQDKCSIAVDGSADCQPDPYGLLQFSYFKLKTPQSDLYIYVKGSPDVTLAAILNSIQK
jgi:hypothetical protein